MDANENRGLTLRRSLLLVGSLSKERWHRVIVEHAGARGGEGFFHRNERPKMAHIEQSQVRSLDAMWANNTTFALPANTWTPGGGKSPNQLWLARAVATMWSRVRGNRAPIITQKEAVEQAMSLFARSRQYGHMAVGDRYGSEQLACAPHLDLWHSAMSTLLHEAAVQNIPELLAASINWYAEHMALLAPLWTVQGVRGPCARALRSPGLPLRPVWPEDTYLYGTLMGLSVKGLPKPTARTAPWLRASSKYWPEIVDKSKSVPLTLEVPIRKWTRKDGGFIAALVPSDKPIFDVMPAIEVDSSGAIINTWGDLGSFPVPDTPFVLIGDGKSTNSASTSGG